MRSQTRKGFIPEEHDFAQYILWQAANENLVFLVDIRKELYHYMKRQGVTNISNNHYFREKTDWPNID